MDQEKISAPVRIKGVEIKNGMAEVTIEYTEAGLSPAIFACEVDLRQENLEEHEMEKIAAIGIGILLEKFAVLRDELVELQTRIDEAQ